MTFDQQEIPFDGTTYREVVQRSETVEQLLINLYAFVLDRKLQLPQNATIHDITNAVADFIVLFLESVKAAQENTPASNPFEAAVNALAELRKPKKTARKYTTPGLRQRIRQILLAREPAKPVTGVSELLANQPAPEIDLDARLDAEMTDPEGRTLRLPENVESAVADLTNMVDATIEKSWETIRYNVIEAFKTQIHVVRRRVVILDILENYSRQQFRRIGSVYLARAMKLAPRQIISAVMESGEICTKGRYRVTEQQLRHDIRRVKSSLSDGIDTLREAEEQARDDVFEIIDNLKTIERKIVVKQSLSWALEQVRKLAKDLEGRRDSHEPRSEGC